MECVTAADALGAGSANGKSDVAPTGGSDLLSIIVCPIAADRKIGCWFIKLDDTICKSV